MDLLVHHQRRRRPRGVLRRLCAALGGQWPPRGCADAAGAGPLGRQSRRRVAELRRRERGRRGHQARRPDPPPGAHGQVPAGPRRPGGGRGRRTRQLRCTRIPRGRGERQEPLQAGRLSRRGPAWHHGHPGLRAVPAAGAAACRGRAAPRGPGRAALDRLGADHRLPLLRLQVGRRLDAVLLRPERVRARLRRNGPARGPGPEGGPAALRHAPHGHALPDVPLRARHERHPVEAQRARLDHPAAAHRVRAGLVSPHVQEARHREVAVERRPVGCGLLVRERPRRLLVLPPTPGAAGPQDEPEAVRRGAPPALGLRRALGLPGVCRPAGEARVRRLVSALLRYDRRRHHLPRLAGHVPRLPLRHRDGARVHSHIHVRRGSWRSAMPGFAEALARPGAGAHFLPIRRHPRLPALRRALVLRRRQRLHQARDVLPQWRHPPGPVAGARGRRPGPRPRGPARLPEQVIPPPGTYLVRAVPHAGQRVCLLEQHLS
mmetsp:Transcript_94950/g.245219  ORF Transcript_94950/g.245219 Transcript_94950/m.245219 type:complete len:490 (-) Transcript_94950:742-2211(-)